MFTKSPFTYFGITSYPITFCKNNPRFFCNHKNTLFTCTLNFQKLYINTHKLYTNKHILHTIKIYVKHYKYTNCHIQGFVRSLRLLQWMAVGHLQVKIHSVHNVYGLSR
jgi:hypothetical protein